MAELLPDYEEPALARAVESLPDEVIDRLPYGAIRLADDGRVLFYSETERRQSGSGELPRLGLDFFSKVAPCMDNPAFRGRLEAARQSGRLDLRFSHIGDFEDRDRELSIRVQSATDGGYWMFLRRERD
ncbi:hypothetical protein [Sphingomonas astaxanthinifaciens]|nr:hypothetical protein [Sphingomonas astaxanthinifaciens]